MSSGTGLETSKPQAATRIAVPKRVKRLLREHAAAAHDEELRRALQPLFEAFKKWSQGTVSSGVLCELIHEFHQGSARDLYVRYNPRMHTSAVARAIATGVLDRTSVPEELLRHLSHTIEYYETEDADG